MLRHDEGARRDFALKSSLDGLDKERWDTREYALVRGIGLSVALACAYFLAIRLGLALLGQHEAGPVLWPASGLAAGVLIALGPRARTAVAGSVFAATMAAGLLAGKPVWLGLCLSLCNAGEALLTASLVDRWCGRPFKFDDWRGLWGFLAAAALASGTAAFGAALAMQELHATPLHEAWRVWTAADGLGIVIIAPVLVGIYHLAVAPPAKCEAMEGTAALGLMAVGSALVFASPSGSPFAQVPPAALFPILLWITARCRPVFAAASALISSTALVGAITVGVGQFGSNGIAIPTAQTMLLIGTLCALTLSALFTERRRSEAALRESNERLRLALGGAELGVWSVDLTTEAFESDERDAYINGHDPGAPPRTLTEVRRCVHPEDLPRLDAAFAAARRTAAPCRAEYRVLPLRGEAGSVRWVAVEGNAVRDSTGRPVRLLGVTRDITERKRAEQALAERTAQLALAGQAGLVGSYSYDICSGMIQISSGFAAIYGLPHGISEIPYEDWRQRVHPDDIGAVEERRARAFEARQCEVLYEYRVCRPDGEVRWIEQRSLIAYGADGRAGRAVGVNIDVTDRKRDEEQKSLLVAELDHRVKNVLAVVSALIARSRDAEIPAAELVATLDCRIKSMAIAHELLSGCRWRGMPLAGLIERELAPYATATNVDAGGPDVLLEAEAGQALAMVMHELITNAAKYGALSVPQGRVSVRWRMAPEDGSGACLMLEWQESGGPAVSPSFRPGYGTSVIRDLVPYELGGTVDLGFPPEGVRCGLQIPGRWVAGRVNPSAPQDALGGSAHPAADGVLAQAATQSAGALGHQISRTIQ